MGVEYEVGSFSYISGKLKMPTLNLEIGNFGRTAKLTGTIKKRQFLIYGLYARSIKTL
jgi:hypothetical protein